MECCGGTGVLPMLMLIMLVPACTADCTRSNIIQQYFADVQARSYDRLTRPSGLCATCPPERIRTNMRVINLENIDHMTNRVTLRIFIRLLWNDERLTFEGTAAEGCGALDVPTQAGLHGEDVPAIWQPDLAWLNSESWTPMRDNSGFIKIYAAGSKKDSIGPYNVLVSQMVSVTVLCPFHPQDFPYDAHDCSAKLGTYRENVRSAIFHFRDNKDEVEVVLEALHPEWAIRAGARINGTELKGSITMGDPGVTGAESRANFNFQLIRRGACYTPHAVVTYLMVWLAYMAFWFPQEVISERLSYAMTMVRVHTAAPPRIDPRRTYARQMRGFRRIGRCSQMSSTRHGRCRTSRLTRPFRGYSGYYSLG